LILSKEHGLKVFENRVLKRIFGPKRDKITGGWRKLHTKEIQNLYVSPNVNRRMSQVKYAACMGVNRNGCSVLLG
jgi:hypothetical protein